MDIISHALWTVEGEHETELYLYEGATVSNTGTWVNVYNNNRNSANTALVEAYSAPTVTAYGTLVESDHAGSGRASGGVGSRSDHEFIGKQNTDYIFIVSNVTAQSMWCDY